MVVITEQLLSFLGVDQAELEVYAGGRYAVIQRDPQPDEEGISQNTDIRLLVVDMEGDPVVGGLAFDFEVRIDGSVILTYISGSDSWFNGFSGTVVEAASTEPYYFYRVVAEQDSPPIFTSEQLVEIRVIVNPSSPDLDVTYSFTVEDLTPPSIVSAEALDAHTVRISFDDEMAIEGPGSALLPGAYTVDTMNVDPVPGVFLEVTGVEEVPGSGSTQFDLEFQWEQTPACEYRINVDPSVTDSSGNPIA